MQWAVEEGLVQPIHGHKNPVLSMCIILFVKGQITGRNQVSILESVISIIGQQNWSGYLKYLSSTGKLASFACSSRTCSSVSITYRTIPFLSSIPVVQQDMDGLYMVEIIPTIEQSFSNYILLPALPLSSFVTMEVISMGSVCSITCVL